MYNIYCIDDSAADAKEVVGARDALFFMALHQNEVQNEDNQVIKDRVAGNLSTCNQEETNGQQP